MKEILKRVSIREYTDEKITKDEIEKMLLAGMSAPTAKNQRAWEFLVCDDVNLLTQISNRCKNHYMAKDAPLVIIVLCNKTKITTPLYVDQDLAAATENILLEATHLGLGSVWLGVAPNSERMNSFKEIFNLSEEYYAFSAIVIGHPKKENIKERNYDEKIVHYNKLKTNE